MKKLFLFVLLATTCTFTYAQMGTSWGVKAGLNYNAHGDYFESIGDAAENPDRNMGYHFGVFGKLGNDLYFKPELVYTSTKSEYEDGEFEMKKLDAPLLVGIKVLGPVSVFGGPSLQYILDSDDGFSNISIDSIENDFSIGLNFGAAINFNKFAIDIRYERGLSSNEASFLDNNGINIDNRLDTRPDQLILSLSLATR